MGEFNASKHDSAFIETFIEAFKKGEVPDEPNNPFINKRMSNDRPGYSGYSRSSTEPIHAAEPSFTKPSGFGNANQGKGEGGIFVGDEVEIISTGKTGVVRDWCWANSDFPFKIRMED